MLTKSLFCAKKYKKSLFCTQVKRAEQEFIDTNEPADILEEDELDRISSLLQRDNLVRGLGVVEHVYRLLHCTPGTVGVMKNAERQATVSISLAATVGITSWLSNICALFFIDIID